MLDDPSADAKQRSFRRISGGQEGDDYELASKTLRTWRRYETGYGAAEEIADELGLTLFPVDCEGKPTQPDPATLKTIFRAIMERGGAVGSMHIAKQALSLAYRVRGWPPVDWWRIQDFLKGVKRTHGGARRQARPLRDLDLDAILKRIAPPANARAAQEGFLLALGWGGALRSDELVHLAWEAPGLRGTGCITTSSRGIEIRLDVAKTAHDGDGQTVIVPAEDAPLVMKWLDYWVKAAGRQPGRLVFCQMSRSNRPINGQMAPKAVTAVVRRHVLAYLLASGMEEVAARTAVSHYRSHSLRAGYATSAALGGVVPARIQEHCRHKSALTTAGYVRLSQDWADSGLKGFLR